MRRTFKKKRGGAPGWAEKMVNSAKTNKQKTQEKEASNAKKKKIGNNIDYDTQCKVFTLPTKSDEGILDFKVKKVSDEDFDKELKSHFNNFEQSLRTKKVKWDEYLKTSESYRLINKYFQYRGIMNPEAEFWLDEHYRSCSDLKIYENFNNQSNTQDLNALKEVLESFKKIVTEDLNEKTNPIIAYLNTKQINATQSDCENRTPTDWRKILREKILTPEKLGAIYKVFDPDVGEISSVFGFFFPEQSGPYPSIDIFFNWPIVSEEYIIPEPTFGDYITEENELTKFINQADFDNLYLIYILKAQRIWNPPEKNGEVKKTSMKTLTNPTNADVGYALEHIFNEGSQEQETIQKLLKLSLFDYSKIIPKGEAKQEADQTVKDSPEIFWKYDTDKNLPIFLHNFLPYTQNVLNIANALNYDLSLYPRLEPIKCLDKEQFVLYNWLNATINKVSGVESNDPNIKLYELYTTTDFQETEKRLFKAWAEVIGYACWPGNFAAEKEKFKIHKSWYFYGLNPTLSPTFWAGSKPDFLYLKEKEEEEFFLQKKDAYQSLIPFANIYTSLFDKNVDSVPDNTLREALKHPLCAEDAQHIYCCKDDKEEEEAGCGFYTDEVLKYPESWSSNVIILKELKCYMDKYCILDNTNNFETVKESTFVITTADDLKMKYSELVTILTDASGGNSIITKTHAVLDAFLNYLNKKFVEFCKSDNKNDFEKIKTIMNELVGKNYSFIKEGKAKFEHIIDYGNKVINNNNLEASLQTQQIFNDSLVELNNWVQKNIMHKLIEIFKSIEDICQEPLNEEADYANTYMFQQIQIKHLLKIKEMQMKEMQKEVKGPSEFFYRFKRIYNVNEKLFTRFGHNQMMNFMFLLGIFVMKPSLTDSEKADREKILELLLGKKEKSIFDIEFFVGALCSSECLSNKIGSPDSLIVHTLNPNVNILSSKEKSDLDEKSKGVNDSVKGANDSYDFSKQVLKDYCASPPPPPAPPPSGWFQTLFQSPPPPPPPAPDCQRFDYKKTSKELNYDDRIRYIKKILFNDPDIYKVTNDAKYSEIFSAFIDEIDGLDKNELIREITNYSRYWLKNPLSRFFFIYNDHKDIITELKKQKVTFKISDTYEVDLKNLDIKVLNQILKYLVNKYKNKSFGILKRTGPDMYELAELLDPEKFIISDKSAEGRNQYGNLFTWLVYKSFNKPKMFYENYEDLMKVDDNLDICEFRNNNWYTNIKNSTEKKMEFSRKAALISSTVVSIVTYASSAALTWSGFGMLGLQILMKIVCTYAYPKMNGFIANAKKKLKQRQKEQRRSGGASSQKQLDKDEQSKVRMLPSDSAIKTIKEILERNQSIEPEKIDPLLSHEEIFNLFTPEQKRIVCMRAIQQEASGKIFKKKKQDARINMGKTSEEEILKEIAIYEKKSLENLREEIKAAGEPEANEVCTIFEQTTGETPEELKNTVKKIIKLKPKMIEKWYYNALSVIKVRKEETPPLSLSIITDVDFFEKSEFGISGEILLSESYKHNLTMSTYSFNNYDSPQNMPSFSDSVNGLARINSAIYAKLHSLGDYLVTSIKKIIDQLSNKAFEDSDIDLIDHIESTITSYSQSAFIPRSFGEIFNTAQGMVGSYSKIASIFNLIIQKLNEGVQKWGEKKLNNLDASVKSVSILHCLLMERLERAKKSDMIKKTINNKKVGVSRIYNIITDAYKIAISAKKEDLVKVIKEGNTYVTDFIIKTQFKYIKPYDVNQKNYSINYELWNKIDDAENIIDNLIDDFNPKYSSSESSNTKTDAEKELAKYNNYDEYINFQLAQQQQSQTRAKDKPLPSAQAEKIKGKIREDLLKEINIVYENIGIFNDDTEIKFIKIVTSKMLIADNTNIDSMIMENASKDRKDLLRDLIGSNDDDTKKEIIESHVTAKHKRILDNVSRAIGYFREQRGKCTDTEVQQKFDKYIELLIQYETEVKSIVAGETKPLNITPLDYTDEHGHFLERTIYDEMKIDYPYINFSCPEFLPLEYIYLYDKLYNRNTLSKTFIPCFNEEQFDSSEKYDSENSRWMNSGDIKTVGTLNMMYELNKATMPRYPKWDDSIPAEVVNYLDFQECFKNSEMLKFQKGLILDLFKVFKNSESPERKYWLGEGKFTGGWNIEPADIYTYPQYTPQSFPPVTPHTFFMEVYNEMKKNRNNEMNKFGIGFRYIMGLYGEIPKDNSDYKVYGFVKKIYKMYVNFEYITEGWREVLRNSAEKFKKWFAVQKENPIHEIKEYVDYDNVNTDNLDNIIRIIQDIDIYRSSLYRLEHEKNFKIKPKFYVNIMVSDLWKAVAIWIEKSGGSNDYGFVSTDFSLTKVCEYLLKKGAPFEESDIYKMCTDYKIYTLISRFNDKYVNRQNIEDMYYIDLAPCGIISTYIFTEQEESSKQDKGDYQQGYKNQYMCDLAALNWFVYRYAPEDYCASTFAGKDTKCNKKFMNYMKNVAVVAASPMMTLGVGVLGLFTNIDKKGLRRGIEWLSKPAFKDPEEVKELIDKDNKYKESGKYVFYPITPIYRFGKREPREPNSPNYISWGETELKTSAELHPHNAAKIRKGFKTPILPINIGDSIKKENSKIDDGEKSEILEVYKSTHALLMGDASDKISYKQLFEGQKGNYSNNYKTYLKKEYKLYYYKVLRSLVEKDISDSGGVLKEYGDVLIDLYSSGKSWLSQHLGEDLVNSKQVKNIEQSQGINEEVSKKGNFFTYISHGWATGTQEPCDFDNEEMLPPKMIDIRCSFQRFLQNKDFVAHSGFKESWISRLAMVYYFLPKIARYNDNPKQILPNMNLYLTMHKYYNSNQGAIKTILADMKNEKNKKQNKEPEYIQSGSKYFFVITNGEKFKNNIPNIIDKVKNEDRHYDVHYESMNFFPWLNNKQLRNNTREFKGGKRKTKRLFIKNVLYTRKGIKCSKKCS